MLEMVVGLRFDETEKYVVLIRKAKPEWMAGLLNGVGGKIEGDETPKDAMVREYEEETGVKTELFEWTPFMQMEGPDFRVYVLHSKGDIYNVRTVEAEPVIIEKIEFLNDSAHNQTVENLPWMIGLALDNMKDGRPNYAKVYYD